MKRNYILGGLKIMEWIMTTLMVVWTFVGIMFLGTGILSLWWMFKSFSWMDCLKDIETEIKE